MRRLNLVVQELERVNRESDELKSRLQYQLREQSELSRLINSEDDTDKVNKYMQDDLAYERDRNYKIKQQIKEIDLYRNELLRDMRKLQDMQDQTMKDNHEFNYGLQQKLAMIEEIEKEYYFTQEKLKATGQAIEMAKGENNEIYEEKTELQRIIEQLQHERNDLLGKLDHLTRKYDECVREISYDRAEMESHNKQHAKLITSKLIFSLLDTFMRSRLQQGFSEFKSYCSFDNKCHVKLAQLAKLLEKVGKFNQKKALQQWLHNSMKPIGMKRQSQQLAVIAHSTNLKQRMMARWIRAYQKRIRNYDDKTRSIVVLWERISRETLIEKNRAFSIWKETMQKFRLRRARVKKLLFSQYFKRLSYGFNSWVNHNANLDLQVRLNLLKMNFSQKQYLTILLNNFRLQTTDAKRKRHNTLIHYLKSWQDYLRYQKFLMGANVAALNLRKQLNTTQMKSCYDAINEHRVSEKYAKTFGELQNSELPKIAELTQFNEDYIAQRKQQRTQQALEAVKRQMAKKLSGYFEHWKSVNEDYKEKLRTTIKDKIIKHYNSTIGKAFYHWKKQHNATIVELNTMSMTETQEEQTALQNEVYSKKQELADKQDQRDQSQKRHTLRCVESYERRLKQLAVGRWRDKCQDMLVKENGASTVIKRLRLRLLRKAFDFYLAGVNSVKKSEMEEQRCNYIKSTLAERQKRRVLNAWRIFKTNHTRAKKYWYRIYLRLDMNIKQCAIKKWREVSQYKVEKEMQQEQTMRVEEIETLNNQIGYMHIDETQQKQEINGMQKTLTTQARRILSNAFVRYYNINQTRGFEKWRDYVIFEKNKERLLRKFIDHWQKYQFYFVKSVIRNWMLNCDIEQRKKQVKEKEIEVKDTDFQKEKQMKEYEGEVEQLNSTIAQTQEEQRVYSQRLGKSVDMIVNRVHVNHYTVQKRYIFSQWRQYVKREVNFIRCIQNVIQKSLWQKGLLAIKDRSREVQQQRTKSTVLDQFRLKFWKRTVGNAFSTWRSGKFQVVTQTIEECLGETNQRIEEHESKKAQIKEHNAVRSERILKTMNIKNLFQSWKNVTQYLKLQNSKNDFCQQEIYYYWKRNALLKWRARKEATQGARTRYNRLKQKVRKIRLRFFFNAIRDQHFAAKSLCNRLANLAQVMNNHVLKSSFNTICSYSRAKSFVFDKRKETSCVNIQMLLESLLLRKKAQYLADLKIRCVDKREETWLKGFTIINNLTKSLRYHFNKWKYGSNERQLAKELHEEGPVREQAFEFRNDLINLTDFMKREGYDDQEIMLALQEERLRQGLLVLKAVRRMQHYNEEGYLKPKVFDRWREYVHMKKLFRYYLKQAAKRGEFIKADLHWAFDQWKQSYPKVQSQLKKTNKHRLDGKMIHNNLKLDNLAENIADKENLISHLNDQREALLDNYVIAQKLALTLWRNYNKRSLHQSFLKWSKAAKDGINAEKTDKLRKNIQLLENLKGKIREFEESNESLANENEELRQFSMDGYEIAKNVQTLTSEREKLSVDLADKAQMIRKLLDENERLTFKLRNAQEEAQSMIRSTMAGSSGFKTGFKGFVSPFSANKYF